MEFDAYASFQAKLPMSEIQETISEFRNRHLSELTEVCNYVIIQWSAKLIDDICNRKLLTNKKISSKPRQSKFPNGSNSRIAVVESVDVC